jgi:hypothetical protein
MAGRIDTSGDSPPTDYPGTDIPCIYADGVLSAAYSPANAKFYLYRVDSHPYGKSDNATIAVAQVVMPIENFAASAQFFVQRLVALESHPALRKKVLEEIKQLCDAAILRG